MTKRKTAAASATPAVTAPSTVAPAPKAKAARKVATNTKTAAAKKIFDKYYGVKKREDIVKMFVEKVGLTHNGAGSYYGKMQIAHKKASA